MVLKFNSINEIKRSIIVLCLQSTYGQQRAYSKTVGRKFGDQITAWMHFILVTIEFDKFINLGYS
jgi:hypothetical protein